MLVSRGRPAGGRRDRRGSVDLWRIRALLLYMAMVLIAPVAGTGLCHLGWLLWRGRHLVTPIVTIVIVASALGLHMKVGGEPSPPFYDGSRWAASNDSRAHRGRAGLSGSWSPSPPSLSWSNGGRRFEIHLGCRDVLKWLRGDADSQTVIATNVPGAALYAALCECREYYQTDRYAPEFIEAESAHSTASLFVDRERLLTAWILGQPGSVEALRRVGITYLIVDHLNGFPNVNRICFLRHSVMLLSASTGCNSAGTSITPSGPRIFLSGCLSDNIRRSLQEPEMHASDVLAHDPQDQQLDP